MEVTFGLHLTRRIATLGTLLSVSWGSREAAPGQPSRVPTTRALGRDRMMSRWTSRGLSPKTFWREEFGARVLKGKEPALALRRRERV